MPREQDQFLEVVDRDTAERRWLEAVQPRRLDAERVPLGQAHARVLAADVVADEDVPAFDRSNLDGYALRAEETFGATEETSRTFLLNKEELATGIVPKITVTSGTATPIATGGMLPRGADAVVMVEHTALRGSEVLVFKPAAPGSGVSFAGTDIARGELVLREGTLLTARETGVLAAIGRGEVEVVRRPRVAILSTGDEIVPPGVPLPPASVFDANATLLADAVRELGCEPVLLGIVADEEKALDAALERALAYDVVLLSGGTSKGAGDLSYRVLERRRPGIIVHGVALKPGKPLCLGAVGTIPVAILPGFPTSAIFTFHELVAPLLRRLAGRRGAARDDRGHAAGADQQRARAHGVPARQPGGRLARTGGVPDGEGFGLGDGVQPGGRVSGHHTPTGIRGSGGNRRHCAPGREIAPVDLVAIGSHCVGLDLLLGLLQHEGFTSKTMWVGSQGGLIAARRGECDVAGVHLFDPETGLYNSPFLPAGTQLVSGYVRMQGIVSRPGDERFETTDLTRALADPGCVMVNRNRGSGTRVLIEGLLAGRRPPGYAVEARSHNAVAAALVQGRADWGVAIAPVARLYGLAFRPLRGSIMISWSRSRAASARRSRRSAACWKNPPCAARLAALGFPAEDARP